MQHINITKLKIFQCSRSFW